jgi:hypothetical protein
MRRHPQAWNPAAIMTLGKCGSGFRFCKLKLRWRLADPTSFDLKSRSCLRELDDFRAFTDLVDRAAERNQEKKQC